MDTVDLSVLRAKPTVQGSVQRMYSIVDRGVEYLLCEAVDDGSVFDVGRFFVIDRSGLARNTLRHQIFAAIADPARWEGLPPSQRFGDDDYLNGLFTSPTMNGVRAHGALTHHVGAVDSSTGRVDRSSDAPPSSLVLIRRMPVVRPIRTRLHSDSVYDYSLYNEAPSKVLALEQIVRLGLPGGSAVLSRFKELGGTGATDAATYLRRYGAALPLQSWSSIPRPICDWQSKYEDHDRNLAPQEALYIAGTSADDLTAVGHLLLLCSLMVDALLSRGGLTLWDLKWEVAVKDGEPLIADTMDHDSMRITHAVEREGTLWHVHFNKQAIRDYYKVFHPDWVRGLQLAKEASKVDVARRPFMELYRDGVASQQYPSIPALDPEYADLQARKYDYVTDIARDVADEGTGAELARAELSYYESRGRLDDLMTAIAPAAL
jgi:phosphoribosylaminoimidazole-succinocarboxamide synthase